MPDRDAVLEVFQGLVAEYPDLTIKGAKSDYCAVNGNMFAFLDPEGMLCLRLSEARKKAFNAEHGTSDVIQYNAVMRGYIGVPDAMVADAGTMKELFAEVVEHARGLKPKPTTKKKK